MSAAATRSMPSCVRTLLIDKPKGNVLDSALCGDLLAQLRRLQGDVAARLLVVEGAGPNFSFGASVQEHLPEHAAAMLASLRDLILALVGVPFPTLAAVRGRCLGGGLEVALACDMMWLEEGAVLGAPEIRLGVFAPWTTALLPASVPRAAAAEILLSGRDITADEALGWGIANRIVPRDEMAAALATFAGEHFEPRSGASLRVATRAWRTVGRGDVRERMRAMEQLYLEELLPLRDGTEGIRAFLEKRPPRWENR